MGRAPCCDKANVKKGPWSPEEDRKLKEYIESHGTGGNWIALPQKAGLRRCGKSCRLRWLNYLRPNIKHGEFSDDEDKVICTLFASIGSSYPSLSIFQNSNININAPLSSSSPPSSYLYSTNTSSHHDHQTLSIPSSPTTAPADRHRLLRSQDHRYLGLGPMEGYQAVKDSSTLVMFGGDQASCSSNSDGSCHYEYGTVGVYDHNNMGNLQSDSYKEFGGNYEKEKGYYGDSSLDCSLEEIKQLISTNLCSSNIDNNLNFFVDETKEVEKVMYY
ncbi:Homeodomain-like protein [Cynara cardunculus var. scolymus]|uniref:Homeodomain-like protein n=1 Tax=Cynara cardunculus var. scolymus TaxID=59895 RepID=A0A103YI56_CYNCS|nr:Homeodomain-like protein [Cynara cardunculus var. scolymus]